MKGIILLNGEPYRGKIDDTNARVYCCDGAYDWAKGACRIDVTLGDFDSLSYLPDPPPSEIYPSQKDETDGEIALFRAIEEGCNRIVLYGGGGKREDHFLGNLHLLYAARQRGVHAELLTNYARIFVAEGETVIRGARGKTVSVVPFGETVHILECSGFYYPMPNQFSYGTTRGISNVVTEEDARFVAQGKLLVFINHE
ncbi:MAG: thiamine diphosphokinase [Clostridia bacterium]|nr:thiamine diphosphokinase [Clostridia bacterium]